MSSQDQLRYVDVTKEFKTLGLTAEDIPAVLKILGIEKNVRNYGVQYDLDLYKIDRGLILVHRGVILRLRKVLDLPYQRSDIDEIRRKAQSFEHSCSPRSFTELRRNLGKEYVSQVISKYWTCVTLPNHLDVKRRVKELKILLPVLDFEDILFTAANDE